MTARRRLGTLAVAGCAALSLSACAAGPLALLSGGAVPEAESVTSPIWPSPWEYSSCAEIESAMEAGEMEPALVACEDEVPPWEQPDALDGYPVPFEDDVEVSGWDDDWAPEYAEEFASSYADEDPDAVPVLTVTAKDPNGDVGLFVDSMTSVSADAGEEEWEDATGYGLYTGPMEPDGTLTVYGPADLAAYGPGASAVDITLEAWDSDLSVTWTGSLSPAEDGSWEYTLGEGGRVELTLDFTTGRATRTTP